MTHTLPPLVFQPRLVPKIWGGQRLATVLGKGLPPSTLVGESWEVYDFPPAAVSTPADARDTTPDGWCSAVVAGPEAVAGRSLHDLLTASEEAVLGPSAPVATAAGPQFPLLVKFLDAREDLSVQVHPTADYAARHPGSHLKTECWVILDHTPNASLYIGLKPGVTRERFADAIRDGTVVDLIHRIPARVGDCHFLPSGTVHALGAGVLVAEVQTPSDTTFRVWDFGRLENGKPRPLHIEQALACIDFDAAGAPPRPTSTRRSNLPLADCPYFRLTSGKYTARTVQPLTSGMPRIWLVIEGSVKLQVGETTLSVRKGQTVLLPARLPPGTLARFPVNTQVLEAVPAATRTHVQPVSSA
ncbi:MAG: type I phosphomannose isomerase catalytic subunit [Tepidisphaerales bacterium]